MIICQLQGSFEIAIPKEEEKVPWISVFLKDLQDFTMVINIKDQLPSRLV